MSGKPAMGPVKLAAIVGCLALTVLGVIFGMAIAMLVGLLAFRWPHYSQTYKQNFTVHYMREISDAIEEYAVDHNVYPVTRDFDELHGLLEPKYAEELERVDCWGNAFAVDAHGDGYMIGSGGKDGEGKLTVIGEGGPVAGFDSAIVLSNGEFIQWPDWLERPD